MVLSCCKYLFHLQIKTTVLVALLCYTAINTTAQQNHLTINSNKVNLNTMLRFTFKPPLQVNQQLAEYTKPKKNELMYWPNFPLNAGQIEARDKEWDRKHNQPFLKQMANVIIDNYVNSLVYGKKMPVAVTPKF